MPAYRSKLEEQVADVLSDDWEYEPQAFPYTSAVQGGECTQCNSKFVRKNRKYTPDFVHNNTWIEVKGYFKPTNTTKYKDIRKYYPTKELIFVFSNPNKPIRKGSKKSMSDWADKNGWRWCTLKTIESVLK